MPSVTIKLPAPLDKKVRAAAKRRGESISLLARRALEREILPDEPDFATLATKQLGIFRGPPDLSSREGYGR